MATVITIISKRNGFRRCGVAHSDKPKDWPVNAFTVEQWQALLAEPQLILAVKETSLYQASEQRDESTTAGAGPLSEAPNTLQNVQSQAPETSPTTLGDAVVTSGSVPVDSGVFGFDGLGPGPISLVIEQNSGQSTVADIELEKLWEEARQEELAREESKDLAAKTSAKPRKPKATKVEGDGK
ncbi:hypothetical protein AO268_04250 [Pseudomonas sp. ICMP 8385]|uniref:HI1506-related protein n=1 Tax=Pseudomonas sp. ICMP 8385 TaxID=1718920 RepID=UPI000C068383|nr:HI1506-related protein [Pseudomonas sp. ICMP 8385]PHN55656.1 hypothetical protein AO268_04250 [Pseudomonas sp. ICMP 8385]